MMHPDEIEFGRRLVLWAVIIAALFNAVPILKLAWRAWIADTTW